MNDYNGRRRKPSVKEISGMTGFSPATVSLVLNNKGSFSEETRNTIMHTFEELMPDHTSVMKRRCVRLLIEETVSLFETDPYNSEIIRGIESECKAMGYEIMLTFVQADNDPEPWLEGTAGLILLGGGLITDSLVLQLQNAKIPLILADNYTHQGDALSVHSDHYGAGFLATQYLISRGHRKIGFISGPAKYKPLIDRYAGYCAAFMEHGLAVIPEYVSPCFDHQFHIGFYEMKYLMELQDRPTAVFAVSDRSALGAIHALQDLGLTQGKDIELMGCDNIPAIREISPRIATVHIPRWEVGQMAVRFLMEAMKGNKLSGKVVIPGKVIIPDKIEETE